MENVKRDSQINITNKSSVEKEINNKLCNEIRRLIKDKNFLTAEQQIKHAMSEHAHSPIPHNLMGILLETQKDHRLALKHFRAAYALDPTYWPVKYNMDQYVSFLPISHLAYDEDDDCNKKQGKRIFTHTLD
ncbi:hypothetical protein SAMN02746066_03319 [Anaerosporobacter mobilis DSM 15930]|jgi:Tfp pilus assembly protein PilF|uniref:Tetratricopeptide repeat-containing protein n=1 Tax=Anaerosporobacter mobilis DSM 15930 TaxID=1120996 RepID=A0A1M7LPD4_9FIRM|nr:hypothetical protein [Anaerosporobacter mobilis]SHM79515.1 hypothetical protein SAMN02746066_03319 [Anaerosporobacter mobilis DSM 15930]